MLNTPLLLVLAASSRARSAEESGYGTDTRRMPSRDGALFPLPQDFPEALAELERNVREHDEQHAQVCRRFYCGAVVKAEHAVPTRTIATSKLGQAGRCNQAMLGAPSTDFCDEMEASKAQIHVSREPLFSAEEMDRVIADAEREGLTNNDAEQKRRSEERSETRTQASRPAHQERRGTELALGGAQRDSNARSDVHSAVQV
jgi:hypothetical protein